MLTEILREKGYKVFRNYPFVDREEEIAFLKEYFETEPSRILFLYGPKSSGKTTLIEYVVENELFEDFENLKPRDNYWVRYVNLRGKLISSYGTFFESFIKSEEDYEVQKSISAGVSIAVITLKAEVLKQVKERKKDLFDALIDELYKKVKKENKKPILIIDEIQTLEEIYINGERELLKEFLNFCVRLTKETHLSHVVILTSNTIFLNRIYNDSKLKETSIFKRIDHPSKEIAEKLLKDLGYNESQINLILEYFGNIISRLLYLYTFIKPEDSIEKLKEFLEKEKLNAKMQILEILKRYKKYNLPKNAEEIFMNIADRLMKDGLNFKDLTEEETELIDILCEREILFFDPQTGIITPNSRIYLKAVEDLVLSVKQ
ncbi:ATP-binding protein [Hippea alviniae]|uniref:ATP-binding protein n=1 Tax=Hippea alviniae TaxID=1279027 RepID=UPI0003B4CCEF|nr:ATP-binding protein [Hippea alviniae]